MEIAEIDLARRKHVLRGWFRQASLARSEAARRRDAAAACARLARMPVFREAQTVALYCALKGELDPLPLFDLCRRLMKAVVVPVADPATRGLDFTLLRDGIRWGRDAHGIPAPAPSSRCLIDPANIELLVVPGRAFTPWGGRLGAGGGYYDRFLERFPLLPTVGLAFNEQVTPRLPLAAHDAAVDWVVTPGGVYEAR